MVRIVTVWGAGIGSSVMLKHYTEQILKTEGIEAEVEANEISTVCPDEYDIVITTSAFADVLRNCTAQLIINDNITDKVTLRNNLLETIKQLNG